MKAFTKRGLAVFTALTMSIGLLAACGNTAEETTTTAATQAEETEGELVNPDLSDLGGIMVYTRDSASGTREAFQDVIGFGDEEDGQDALVATAIETSGNGDMATKVGQDTAGIGYVSLTTDMEANNIKTVAFNSVEPSEETVLDGTYTLSRPFNYVTRASGDFVDDETEELVAAFVAFLTESEEGMEVIQAEGGIVDSANASPWAEVAADYPVVNEDNSSRTIRTKGSTSVAKIIEAASQAFSPLAGNVVFEMDQTGSGDGWKRVLGGDKDGASAGEIGFASRGFKDEEPTDEALAAGTFNTDAVVVVVEAGNGLVNLTTEQVEAIYTGDIASWADVE